MSRPQGPVHPVGGLGLGSSQPTAPGLPLRLHGAEEGRARWQAGPQDPVTS